MGDDFSGFMARNVPDHLRRRALRKLWVSNPVLANLDGLPAERPILHPNNYFESSTKGFFLGYDSTLCCWLLCCYNPWRYWKRCTLV